MYTFREIVAVAIVFLVIGIVIGDALRDSEDDY